MTYPLGEYRTFRDKDRLHETLFLVQAVFESVGRASYHKLKGQPAVTEPGDTWDFGCLQFPELVVRTPIHGPLDSALKNEVPYSTGFGVVKRTAKSDATSHTVMPFFMKIFLPFFVEFYEDYVGCIKALSDPTQFTKWPNVWQFARIVRNAAAHGGLINIKDATLPAVTWYKLTYSSNDYGRGPFKADLFIGDMLVLMKEMSEELDKVGCCG